MRESNYRKKIHIDKKVWYGLGATAAAALLAGIIFFFAYFHVEKVEVIGSSHYSDEEVKEMILRGPLASNSVLAPMLYSTDNTEDVPFVDGFTVTQLNRSTIAISVKEKQPVGCIRYLDSYIYFDRTGTFIEGSLERDESVPYFDGIQVNRIVMDEELPIKGDTVLNTAVALSTIFQKNEMIPDHIQFDESYQISLLYDDITVMLGKDEFLEDKMARVIAILPQISGKKGILHVESVTDSVKTITFEEEVEPVTAENWTGGYDENGDYTGYDEYDENGNYVGPKPMSELDYALENWVGGYDEELDYTGVGEYDVNGNYVGPPPTEESLAANGDWKGGYEEDGSYTGTGEYDREGTYVGPNPNGDSGSDSGAEDGYSEDGYSEGGYSEDEYSEDDSWDEYTEDDSWEDGSYDESGDSWDGYSDYGYEDYGYYE